ncbi:MAG: hypothetical protein CMN30_16040 [Sandaracinus sp.]|nr:hypothetical protein [Sandaracinus sp.]|tara:strand:- start:83 stop:448 length:366 start_codon:yes stop_codon:yes gene_type:complete
MMGRFTPCLGLLLALSLAAGCGSDEPEHTYETGIQPTSGGEGQADTGPGIDEAEATNIALTLAEQEGHDIAAYSDVVVHANEDGDWVVQLRRPRIIRFLEVVVDKDSGHADLSVRSAGADG